MPIALNIGKGPGILRPKAQIALENYALLQSLQYEMCF